MAFQNKFPGECKCGAAVAAGAGSCSKVRGRWIVICGQCSGAAPKIAIPQREMVGAIYWPNGMGYTECTEEYEIAHGAMMDALQAWRDATGGDDSNFDPECSELYNAYCTAQHAFDQLVGDGGHIGERVTFDKPDVMAALLGYGRVSIVPGGEMKIVQCAG